MSMVKTFWGTRETLTCTFKNYQKKSIVPQQLLQGLPNYIAAFNNK